MGACNRGLSRSAVHGSRLCSRGTTHSDTAGQKHSANKNESGIRRVSLESVDVYDHEEHGCHREDCEDAVSHEKAPDFQGCRAEYPPRTDPIKLEPCP